MFNRKKDGVPPLLKVAGLLCHYLSKFTPFLADKYAGNTALIAALTAASAACQVLELELVKVRDYGD